MNSSQARAAASAALVAAFESARAVGYAPRTPEMLTLNRAQLSWALIKQIDPIGSSRDHLGEAIAA
ncbi:MAG: hypothetical protein JWN57_202 [Frankiales bacterium]|jgi:hypothetical protein|nr:hypothetical protein [Frankiales bacterium]